MKISKIELKDYRAFYGNNYKIDIPNGKNLIIYGENGSGKSSLFQAVSDFFESAVNNVLPFAKHIKAADDRNEQYVKLTFTDYSVQPIESIGFQFSNLKTDTNQAEGQFIAQTFNLKSFLSYKQILKTYLFDTKNNFENHFFDLLVSELIGSINNSFTNNPINQDWQELKENPEDTILAEQLEKGVNEIIGGIIYPDPKLDNIPGVNTYLNSYLEYFKQDLSVQLNPCKIEIDNKKINATISLKLTLFGEELDNHIEILNEARLSALALSIYFSAIQKSVAVQLKYKILFLDDIFIGLDLSNRIPLLDILRNEFKEYQIFITTYDRHWYELAKEYLDSWLPVELYINKNDGLPFETPSIIDKDLSYLSKAEKYYNISDYISAGNLLRKEVERILKTKLPTSYKIIEESEGEIKLLTLELLIQRFIAYYEDCDITLPKELLNAIKTFKKVVLNPSSHDDIKSPIYKKEIETTFEIVRLLNLEPVITRKLLVEMHTPFKYTNTERNYEAIIELANNLYYYKYGNNHSFTRIKYRMMEWVYQGIEHSNMNDADNKPLAPNQIINITSQTRTIDEIINGIFGNRGLNIEAPNPHQFTQKLIANGKSLSEILLKNYREE